MNMNTDKQVILIFNRHEIVEAVLNGELTAGDWAVGCRSCAVGCIIRHLAKQEMSADDVGSVACKLVEYADCGADASWRGHLYDQHYLAALSVYYEQLCKSVDLPNAEEWDEEDDPVGHAEADMKERWDAVRMMTVAWIKQTLPATFVVKSSLPERLAEQLVGL